MVLALPPSPDLAVKLALKVPLIILFTRSIDVITTVPLFPESLVFCIVAELEGAR